MPEIDWGNLPDKPKPSEGILPEVDLSGLPDEKEPESILPISMQIFGPPEVEEGAVTGITGFPVEVGGEKIKSTPTLRGAPEISLLQKTWEAILDKFKDPEKESAAAVLALVDSENLGISPDAAYRLKSQIDGGMTTFPKANMKRTTAWGRVNKRWERGMALNEANNAYGNWLKTNDDKWLDVGDNVPVPSEEDVPVAELGIVEDAVGAAAELMPMMIQSTQEAGWKGVTLGSGFAAIAALAGQPELIPVAAQSGLTVGMTWGAMDTAMMIEGGAAVRELRQIKDKDGKPLNRTLVRGAAWGIGTLNSVFEVAGLKALVKTIPGGDKIFKEAVYKTIKSKALKDRLLYLAKEFGTVEVTEVGVELAQESTNIVMEELAKYVSESVEGTDFETDAMEIINRLRETGVEAAKGFAVLTLPGLTVKTITATPESISDFESGLSEETRATYEAEKSRAIAKGQDEVQATESALKSVMETPEVQARIDEIKRKAETEGIPTTEQVLERITTEELTDEQLTEMLDIFAEGQDIIAEDVEAVSEIKNRLIDIGMPEEEASSNAALYAGFDVLAKRAGVPLDDLITRYLPEISQRDMIPEITDEDRRIVSDNPVLNNVITDEAQLESFDELRGIRNDLETELEANRDTWSEDQISQQEEAIDYLNTKVTEEQLIGGIPRGRIRFYSDKVNIDLLKDADQSTFVHETGHLYLMMMNDLANVETASQELKDDFQIIKDWLGVVDGEITRDQNEQFARGFEAYLREGKAPTPALKKAFENFKKWLMEIYRSLSDLDVELTDDVRGAMDRMFIDEGMEAPVRGEVTAAERGVEFEQAPTKTTFKEETEPTFSPRDITSNPVPADILENPAKAVKNYLPSHAEKGQYFYMTANDLQAHLDKHGDGFLYRVGDRRSVEGGFERGKQGYLHKFATENKKTLALNTSFEGAKKYLASSLSPEYNIIYRIMPQDLADDFIIHIPSNEAARNEGDLIIHSPKPASTSMARVLYSQGNFTEEDTDVSRRAIEQRRAAKVEEGTRRAAGVRVRPGVAEGRPGRVGTEAESGIRAELEQAPKKPSKRQKPVKTIIREVTGQVKDDELRDLRHSFIKAARAAREAYKAGKTLEASKWKKKALEIALEARSRNERKKILSNLKNIKKKNANSRISVEYKKKIDALLEGIDFTNMTDKKRNELESLSSYLEENGQPLGIQPKYIREIKRLSQKQPSEMATEDLRNLLETVKHLKSLGKLKAKLLKFADARELNAKKSKLIKSTINLDRKPPVTKLQRDAVRKRHDLFLDGIQNVYINTMHSFRVTDMIDGFKNGNGENTKIIRKLNKAERKYHSRNTERMSDFLERRSELLGDKKISEKEYASIMIHGRFQEGSYDAVQVLSDEYGFNIPEDASIKTSEDLRQYVPISDDLLKYVDLIRKTVSSKTNDIAALHEELTNTVFEKVDNYFAPLLYERTAAIEPNNLIREDFKDVDASGNFVNRTKKTTQGFVKKRRAGVKKLPRIDIEAIVSEALSAQEWYLNMQPELINTADLVFSKEYQEAAGSVASNWWKNQIDIIARKGWQAGYRPNAFSNVLAHMRGNLNRGVLLYKLSTVMMQPFAVFDAMAYAQARYGPSTAARVAKEFAKVWMVPGYAKNIIEASETLKQRKGGEVALEEVLAEASKTDSIFHKVEKFGAGFIVGADIRTAAAVREGFRKSFEKMDVENPDELADQMVQITQGSSDITYRPHVLSTGEGAKTFFTFQTFFLNRWGLIAHDFAAGVIKAPEYKQKVASLIALAILMLVGYLEDEAREIINQLIGKETKKEPTNIIEDAILFIPEQAPYIGSVIKGKRRGFGGTEFPLESVVAKGISGLVKDIPSGNLEKGLLNTGEAALILYYGMPGTTQLFDLLESSIKDKRKEKL